MTRRSFREGNARRTTPRVGRLWLVVCMALVRTAAVFVPRAQRDDWLQEWRAELWHRGSGGAAPTPHDARCSAAARRSEPGSDAPASRSGLMRSREAVRHTPRSLRIRSTSESPRFRGSKTSVSAAGDLIVRSLGAFRHAVWLRSQEWKPDMLLQDVRYALRDLRGAPTFTLMALLTLGVGIGANAIVFNMLDSVLLTPYPFEAPEELVGVFKTASRDPGVRYPLSWPTYLDIRESGVFDDIAVWDWEPMSLRGDDETVYIDVAQVTPSLFNVMRVEPIAGRAFTPEEGEPGGGGVVILTEGFWRTQFGADEEVIGRTIQLDGSPRVVVGVMPQGYSYPDEIEAWVPLTVTVESAPRSSNWLGALARMRPGMSMEQTTAELRPVAERIENEFPDLYAGRGFSVTSLRDQRVGGVRPFMYILLGAVGFLLLIVCANVANLLLARASAREHEISVRLALGASRTRLVRQLLTESLILALGGLAIGFAFSNWAVRAIFSTIPVELPVWIEIRTNFADIAFMAGVALFATILFGLAPALQATRPNVRGAFAETSGRTSGNLARRLTRNGLVVAEVALSVMLLVGAGLMARSFAELSGVSPGFEADGRLMATMQMPRGKYASSEMRVNFYREMIRRVGAMPGVDGVAAVSRMPMSGSSIRRWFRYEGQDPNEEVRRNPRAPLYYVVSPGYFETLGIPLRSGRTFEDADSSAAPRVVLVNQNVVDRYFADDGALGKRISFDGGESWWEIVGIVGSVRHYGLDQAPQTQVYVPYEQNPQGRLSIVVRTAGDPAALAPQLRREIRDIDPDQALYDVMPMTAAVAESVWVRGFFSRLMRVFSLLAAGIAAVGIYGVTAYSVSRRTHELGVRMALGADRVAIVRMVIRQSMIVVAIGVVIGFVLAAAQGMALESMLYEISGTDPATFATVAALVLAVSLTAAWLPARRATRLDPVSALRDE